MELEAGTLYDMNKQLIKEDKPLDPIVLNKKLKELSDKILDGVSEYYMLLCRERYDYTIFKVKDITTEVNVQKEIKETLNNRGFIIAIDKVKDDDNAFEIWIRDFVTEENFVYYLFDYHNAIVEI